MRIRCYCMTVLALALAKEANLLASRVAGEGLPQDISAISFIIYVALDAMQSIINGGMAVERVTFFMIAPPRKGGNRIIRFLSH